MSHKMLGAVAAATVVVSTALAFTPARAEPADVTGVWLDHTGRGAVEIADCGGHLCGRIVWVAAKAKSKAKGEAACGLQILGDVKPIGAGVWDHGWIYSPEQKERFDVEVRPIDGNSLQVTGYAGTKDMSEQMTWTRAPADLARCAPEGASASSAAAAAGAAAVGTTVAAKRSTETRARQRVARQSKPARQATTVRVATCRINVPFHTFTFACKPKAARILARL